MAKLTMEQIAGYAKQAGFPDSEIATAVAVAMAESGGDTTAYNQNSNRSTDYGLWQINTVHGPLLTQYGDKFDPLANAKMALTVWQRAGNKWTPWVVYKSGVYRIHLLEAQRAAAKPADTATNPPVVSGSAPAVDDPNTGPIDAFNRMAASVETIIKAITEPIASFNALMTRLGSGGFWLRIGAFILGFNLVLFALIRLSGTDKAVVALGKTAASVAVKVPIK